VIGFLETLQSRIQDLSPAQQQELLGVTHRSALRLSVQLSNLMVWSRIESRTGLDSAVPPEGTPVADVLAGLLAEPSASVPTASVHIDDDVRVPMSPEDLHTVLANLLTNAALYGAPPVEVRASVRGTRVSLAVTDRGPGLPPEHETRAFEPFVQASEGLRRTAQGLGLGLAIVRALATSVGGDVRYEIPPGGGARFVVDLPTLPEPSAA
jgi:signal transduction histidine kinase